MEAVNADFHKFDVFVRWPAPRGEAPTILRPQMVAFQDWIVRMQRAFA
jgi:hypothetical protein